MKKIVGIIAALAMASAVFAADVSAKVQLEGNLFNYNADKSMSALDINKPSDQHWNPVFNLGVNTDNGGAEFVVYTGSLGTNGGWNKAFNNGSNRFKIWLSPADGLKLTFGLNGFNLNQEHIRWSKSDSGVEDYGYSLNYSNDGLSIDVGLLPGWGSPWFSKADGGDANIAMTAFKFQYGADFGTVNAIFTFKTTAAVAAKPAVPAGKKWVLDPVKGPIQEDTEAVPGEPAKDKGSDMKFGLGYANNFDGINFWANFLGYYAGDFNKARIELYADGSADAFGWAIFPVFEIYPKADDKFEAFLIAKATYALDGATAYFEFADLQGLLKFGKDDNPWDGANKANFKIGATGNVGGAGWDVGAQIILGSKVDFSIPVSFSYGW